jgi:hypothetical protein
MQRNNNIKKPTGNIMQRTNNKEKPTGNIITNNIKNQTALKNPTGNIMQRTNNVKKTQLATAKINHRASFPDNITTKFCREVMHDTPQAPAQYVHCRRRHSQQDTRDEQRRPDLVACPTHPAELGWGSAPHVVHFVNANRVERENRVRSYGKVWCGPPSLCGGRRLCRVAPFMLMICTVQLQPRLRFLFCQQRPLLLVLNYI